MPVQTDRSISTRSRGSRASQDWSDLEQLQDLLIENYPIVVRGAIAEAQGEIDDEQVVRDVANRLIKAYPMFVRGVFEAVQENDFEEVEEEEEEESMGGRGGTEEEEEDTRRTRSFRGQQHRGSVTDPAHDRRLRPDTRRSLMRGSRSRRAA